MPWGQGCRRRLMRKLEEGTFGLGRVGKRTGGTSREREEERVEEKKRRGLGEKEGGRETEEARRKKGVGKEEARRSESKSSVSESTCEHRKRRKHTSRMREGEA